MTEQLNSQAFDQIFHQARTYSAWQNRSVAPQILEAIYNTMRMGPTAANCCPLRIVFVTSDQAKEQLKPCLGEGNIEKTMAAPVTAILAGDFEFTDYMPRLFPHVDARPWFADPKVRQDTMIQNANLQSAYFMIAARAYGLDCGPMGGFDKAKVDAAFFAGTPYQTILLCNLGYGDTSKLHPRLPRLAFDETCKVI